MRTLLALAAPLALAIGCASPDDPAPGPPITVLDLRAATGRADFTAVGVAVDPSGARFVFDELSGLYRVDGQTVTQVLPLAELPDPGNVVLLPFTDLASVGPDRFALTAIGDGYLLDVAAHTMTRWFCYVPDALPEEQTQRTDAVAYDVANDLIYAQPRTFDPGGNLIRSEIAEYLGATGIDFGWYPVDIDIDSGGMAILPDRGLVVGDDQFLYVFQDQQLELVLDLIPLGVASVGGLAFDPATSSLLVADGFRNALIEIPLSQLYPRTI